MIPEGPTLWYVNRSTGMVLLALLTVTLLLGALSARPAVRPRVPLFVVHSLHRTLALLSVAMLAVHVTAAVADEYVDIRWWQAFVPRSLHYKPVWLAFGVVALDLLAAVLVTSLMRQRLGHRSWRLVHLTTYAAWGVSVAHGLGIGTDSATGWARWTYLGCAAVVVVSVLLRLHGRRRGGATALPGTPAPAGAAR